MHFLVYIAINWLEQLPAANGEYKGSEGGGVNWKIVLSGVPQRYLEPALYLPGTDVLRQIIAITIQKIADGAE